MARKDYILSLFCGAGGMDIGFHNQGFETALAIDNNPDAVATYNHNSTSSRAIIGDLAKLSPGRLVEMWDEVSELPPRGIIGGPPCQGFSVGNAYADPKDPRNLLPYRYADILERFVSEYGIDFFVFENVPGLLGERHRPRFERIKRRFQNAGFAIHQAEIDAVNFDVAQHRRRLFVVGIREGHPSMNDFAFPTQRSDSPRDVRSAIAGLPRVSYTKGSANRRKNSHHPNHWTMRPKSWRFEARDFNGGRSFRRLAWNEPSWTVAYGNREIHVHPSGRRRLSVYEAMLLQGFPEDYELLGSFSAQVDQVSNAVPPPVATEIARAIRTCIGSSCNQQIH